MDSSRQHFSGGVVRKPTQQKETTHKHRVNATTAAVPRMFYGASLPTCVITMVHTEKRKRLLQYTAVVPASRSFAVSSTRAFSRYFFFTSCLFISGVEKEDTSAAGQVGIYCSRALQDSTLTKARGEKERKDSHWNGTKIVTNPYRNVMVFCSATGQSPGRPDRIREGGSIAKPLGIATRPPNVRWKTKGLHYTAAADTCTPNALLSYNEDLMGKDIRRNTKGHRLT